MFPIFVCVLSFGTYHLTVANFNKSLFQWLCRAIEAFDLLLSAGWFLWYDMATGRFGSTIGSALIGALTGVWGPTANGNSQRVSCSSWLDDLLMLASLENSEVFLVPLTQAETVWLHAQTPLALFTPSYPSQNGASCRDFDKSYRVCVIWSLLFPTVDWSVSKTEVFRFHQLEHYC